MLYEKVKDLIFWKLFRDTSWQAESNFLTCHVKLKKKKFFMVLVCYQSSLVTSYHWVQRKCNELQGRWMSIENNMWKTWCFWHVFEACGHTFSYAVFCIIVFCCTDWTANKSVMHRMALLYTLANDWVNFVTPSSHIKFWAFCFCSQIVEHFPLESRVLLN